MSQLDAIGDVDLIVEADVYLDYGRLNEAIEILEASANQENSVEKIIKIGLKIIELLKKGFPEKSEDIDKMVDRDTEDSFREEFMSFVV